MFTPVKIAGNKALEIAEMFYFTELMSRNRNTVSQDTMLISIEVPAIILFSTHPDK